MSTRPTLPAVVWWVECGAHRAELYDDGHARCSCGTSWPAELGGGVGWQDQRYLRAQLDVHVQWSELDDNE